MSRVPDYGETWVYEGIVGALPGIDISDRLAIALQFTIFEVALLAVAAAYGLWEAVIPGTVAVVVAAVGSWLMLRYSRAVRALRSPDGYRRVLFGSNIEVVLGVMAFVLLVTYLFVVDPRSSEVSLLTEIVGPEPPAVAVALMLLILWDVVYRIGTCWWATVAGLWRALVYEFGPNTTREYARTDGLNVAFAAVQLLFVPFVLGHWLLVAALVGHVIAVVLVATLSVTLQYRSRQQSDQSAT